MIKFLYGKILFSLSNLLILCPLPKINFFERRDLYIPYFRNILFLLVMFEIFLSLFLNEHIKNAII